MVTPQELVEFADTLLQADAFRDYCPNGLQVEGRSEIRRLVGGVTASQALLDAAAAAQADAVLVHHGYFWRGESPAITGIKYRRIKRLMDAGMSLIAYHLPLDAHPVHGNNACLATLLGFSVDGRFGGEAGLGIGMYGRLPQAVSGQELAGQLRTALGRAPLHIAGGPEAIRRLAWCSGAAQSYIDQAVDLQVDAFITGEASEQTVHIARESGIHFYAAGHHATERFGVESLGRHLAEQFDLEFQFIDIENPV